MSLATLGNDHANSASCSKEDSQSINNIEQIKLTTIKERLCPPVPNHKENKCNTNKKPRARNREDLNWREKAVGEW